MTSALYNFKMLCIVLESVHKARAMAALAGEGNRFQYRKGPPHTRRETVTRREFL